MNTKKDLNVSDLPSSLPGLDLTKAMSQLGGKKTLFIRLLGMFEGAHTEDVNKLKAAYDAQDWTAVHEINHALKGVTGNLAANELYAFSVAIDAKVKEDNHDLDAEINGMITAMATLLDSITQAKELPTE
jgi:HPt (histidine-containing phosphotransfer) domain-containing protein